MLGCKFFIPVMFLYIPWLPGMYHDLVASPPEYWHRVPTYNTLKNSFSYLFGPGDLQIYIYAVIFITIPFWILAVHSKKSWRIKYGNNGKLLGLLWLLVVLPVAFFYIKSIYSQPVYNHRHFLHAIPIMSLLTGAVLSRSEEHTSELQS